MDSKPHESLQLPINPTSESQSEISPLDTQQLQAPYILEEPASEAGKRSSLSRFLLVVAIIGVTLAGLLTLGILPRMHRQAELTAAVEALKTDVPIVSVVTAQQAPATVDLVLPGNIQALQETPIYARATGYLKKRFVDIGDRVQAGQLLAEIESPEVDQDLAQARANLAQAKAALQQERANLQQERAKLQQAQAALEFSRKTLQRWKQLGQQALVSYQEVDEKQAAFDAAQANAEAAQATIHAAQANVNAAQARVDASQASVQRLLTLQSFQKVTAPFAGTITARYVDVGALITVGTGTNNQALFKIAQSDVLRIYVNVPQTFVNSIQPDQPAEISVQEFPQKTFAGKVVSTAGALDPTSRTLLAEVRVTNENNLLLPGMYAQVKFTVTRSNPPVLVPGNALVIRPEGTQVATVTKDQTVHYQKVTVGRDYGTQLEIISGLEANETVILDATDDLQEGMRVQAVTLKKEEKKS
ncbi:MAG TPA: efflux RND transporter periplasmic adaptor subunit [Candidatus Limnocylindrales bacterium]|nr:efflux RND transporter periplasmic adaptor subunit [Candidatus Limnocylindrales bacterium]